VDLGDAAAAIGCTVSGRLSLVLDTEHAEFAPDPQPVGLAGNVVRFARPGAIILKG
jgi:hypothetical protein